MKHTAERFAHARAAYRPQRSGRIDPSWTGPNTADLGRLMQQFPNFASLGAIGPDLFFFLPDFRDEKGIPVSSVLITILKFLEDLDALVDPFVSKWEHYLGPVSEDQAEEMSRLTGGLSEVTGDIVGELSGILITALENFVTQQRDWWSFFSLGLNTGLDEQAYFWSDMLHYRSTGQFARALWKKADASDSDAARAYALGYQTHLATDVTGHAFVNSISGGPFRLHWQRHHLVENHMDASWYLEDTLGPLAGARYPQATESALYFDIAFGERDDGPVERPAYPTGGSMRENWQRKRVLDVDSELPDELADLLLSAMQEVFYPQGPHPKILDGDGRPTADLIKEAYDLFFRFLKLTTVDGFSHEPPDPPDVFPNLDFPTYSDPAGSDAPGDDDGDGSFWDDLWDFILSVASVVIYVAEVAAYLATLPWAIGADLATYPLRWVLYYLLELPLYHMLKSFRAVLVMTGYLVPMADEIAPFLTRIGNTDAKNFEEVLDLNGDVFAGWLPPAEDPNPEVTYRDPDYPHSIPKEDPMNQASDANEFRHPWNYPTSVTELHETLEVGQTRNRMFIKTTVGPHAAGSKPSILFGGIGSDPGMRDLFENAAGPGEADAAGQQVQPSRHLGDSVAFSEYFIWLESRDPVQKDGTKVPLVEWNLDADCGYGYQCWDWNRSTSLPPQLDPEKNPFLQPCTWPSQADSDDNPAAPAAWAANVRLKLHWVGPGKSDPGCNPPPPAPPAVPKLARAVASPAKPKAAARAVRRKGSR